MNPAKQRIGFVLVTHGEIGSSLLGVARYILGRELLHFAAVKVPFMAELPELARGDAPFAQRRQLLAERILAAKLLVDQGRGIIVLTDIVGGTAFNTARELLPAGENAIIAGVNLPMVLKATEMAGQPLTPAEAAAQLAERSRRAILFRNS
jgi:PTS system mannose-specific IIA component